MSTISKWINNARATALPQSLFPSLTAIIMAVREPEFSVWLALLAFLGVICGHLGINLFDDYFDYKKKHSSYRDQLSHEGFRARIGKCNYITSGSATVRELLIAAISFCAVAVTAGVIIAFNRGFPIIYIGVITAILGVSYSAPPLRLSYHGIGELVIGFIFGPLNMAGSYYAACGVFDSALIYISIPVGLLVMNIVYVHSIMDYIPDKKIGKRTFAVLLDNKRAMLFVLFIILFAPYFSILYGIYREQLSIYYLTLFITLPMAISLFSLMIKFIKDPDKKISPRFWMGPMSKWKMIEAAGIDWFMIRWLLARNLLSLFCLIIIIVSFL